MSEIQFHDGWVLLPNGFALPASEFPITQRAKHLTWIDNVPVTPWAWRKPGTGSAVEIIAVAFENGRPDFGCTCHPFTGPGETVLPVPATGTLI